MAIVSCTQCVCALLLTVILTWLPGEAVYFESVYSGTSPKQGRNRNSGSSSDRQRRGRDRSRDTDDDESPAAGRSERRRDPFQRTIVSIVINVGYSLLLSLTVYYQGSK